VRLLEFIYLGRVCLANCARFGPSLDCRLPDNCRPVVARFERWAKPLALPDTLDQAPFLE
jgi:hypothetical protein